MSVKLRTYQKDIVGKGVKILEAYHILYLAMEVRTGKTLTALSILEKKGYRNVVFVTKKKAIASIENDYRLLAPSFKLTVINYEQLDNLLATLKPGEIDAVVGDESHSFGAFPKPSKRTIAFRKLCKGLDIILLSGSPSPENYSQLFHQFWVSSFSPFIQYNTGYRGEMNAFYRWAKDFVNIKKKRINATMEVWDYSEGKGDLIWKYIKHLFIMFSQAEAGFDAAVEEHFLPVELSLDARIAYKQLERHRVYSRILPGGREVTATVNSGADLINKLAQISSGTLIFDGIEKGVVIDTSKAQFIKSYFYGKKIAIFYRFKAELEVLQKYFPNWTDSPEVFNSGPDYTFIGQVQSVREGTDLSTADAAVAYNIDFSATTYIQIKARIQNKDRVGSAPFYWIQSTHGIEHKIYGAVSNKKNFTYSYYSKNARKGNTIKNQKSIGESRVHSTETSIH